VYNAEVHVAVSVVRVRTAPLMLRVAWWPGTAIVHAAVKFLGSGRPPGYGSAAITTLGGG
jgi:hypothetical protein